ncbi:MAG TPA: hypothetical protein VIG41_01455 [Micrococcaceae bacterium]
MTPRRATPAAPADPSTPRRATPPAPAEPGWGAISEAPDWATAAPAASTVAAGSNPAPVTDPPSDAAAPGPRKMSRYERLKNSPEAQAGRASAPERKVDLPYVEDIPSADDETIEESGLIGRAAVERILGGRLIEERSVNGS